MKDVSLYTGFTTCRYMHIYPNYGALTLRATQKNGESVENRYKSGIKNPHSR